ncbi:hypothetical protein DSECCO2_590270 [anaerobic digester metagenome]
MDTLGHQFFAGSRFTVNQDRRIPLRHQFRSGDGTLHHITFADDIFKKVPRSVAFVPLFQLLTVSHAQGFNEKILDLIDISADVAVSLVFAVNNERVQTHNNRCFLAITKTILIIKIF